MSPPSPPPSVESAVVSTPRVDCWECGRSTPIDRDFCQGCGVWLGIGKPAALASATPTPVSTRPDTPLGPTSFGPLPLELRRRTFLGRHRIAAISAVLLLAGIISGAALFATLGPGREGAPVTADGIGGGATAVASEATAGDRGARADAVASDAALANLAASVPAPTSAERATARALDGSTAARAATPRSTPRPATRGGWICDGGLRIEDATGLRWTVSRVSFLAQNGHERVVLHLDRAGSDRGDPAAVTAQVLPAGQVARRFPNLRPPGIGKTAIILDLEDGVRSTLGLRGFRPDGLATLKEFSAFQRPDGSSKILVSAAADGCFRLRIPAWTSGGDRGSAQIQLDVRS